MSNPFDFNEEEASKNFEKSVIYGSPSNINFISTSDFMKQSLAVVKENMQENNESDFSHAKGTKNDFNYAKALKETTHSSSLSLKVYYSSSLPLKEKTSSPPAVVKEITPNSSTFIKKGNDDLASSKKSAELLKIDRWTKLPLIDTVQRMIQGKSCWLEGYRSLSEKRSLLDLAVKTNDGNSILTVIIFMERTLHQSILFTEIQQILIASNIYIHYLRQIKEWKKLKEFYLSSFLIEEAAILSYEIVGLEEDPSKKLDSLSKWLSDFGNKPELNDLCSYIKEEIILIKKQLMLEDEIKRINSLENTTSKAARSIIKKPLITTLSYCSLYYYDKNSEYYPEKFKKTVEITNKQFEWAVLPPIANLHKWTEVEHLLTSTKWLGKKKEFSYIGYENVAMILYKAKANEEIILKYLKLIDNLDLRIKWASRFKYHDLAIDCIVQQRDHRKMEEYRMKVENSDKYLSKIDQLLNNSALKWR
ncbi:spermatogenesis-defective protein 39 homolog isoform X2 [Hydra vulgaris]|uniref:spermatogenesis-defective protein 39 homolog isoform X2 n=1 Tax=Hydra vulgaris TaxID=6087 RepID=UPI000640E0E4|nr:spermatogenesis-defective protein 39 homolog isoform X2 [Hydra vulgaris]